jgi:hypothetical protein
MANLQANDGIVPFGTTAQGSDTPFIGNVYPVVGMADAVFFSPGLQYVAVATSSTSVLVSFFTPLTSVNTTPGNYSISGPSVLTVTGVTWSGGGSPNIVLTVSGTFTSGTYTLTIANNTVFDAGSRVNFGTAPFTAPSASSIHLLSIVGGANIVTLTFDSAPVLLQDALIASKYLIIDPNNASVYIYSVTVVGNTVVLSTSWQANGTTYTLFLPQSWFANVGGAVFTGPFNGTFTGVATSPVIAITRTVDARTIDVYFNKPINKLDGLNINNYSINNGLIVTACTQISDSIFRLTTSHQTLGTSYTVTASNIRDFQGIIV